MATRTCPAGTVNCCGQKPLTTLRRFQVVVDAVDHNVLVAACESRVYDLTTATEAELLDIVMPLNFAVRALHCLPHGRFGALSRLALATLRSRCLRKCPELLLQYRSSVHTLCWNDLFQPSVCTSQPVLCIAPSLSWFGARNMAMCISLGSISHTSAMMLVETACPVHGVACWFDVLFDGSVQPRWLTTAPGQPTTHW